MARTTLTKNTAVGPYPASVAADSLDLSFQAADAGNLNQFAPGGDDLILAWNTGATPRTFQVTSSPDQLNRTGDLGPYTVGAGEISHFRVKNMGWVQPDGKIYLQANHSEMKFAILAL